MKEKIKDISERKQTMELLKENEEYYRIFASYQQAISELRKFYLADATFEQMIQKTLNLIIEEFGYYMAWFAELIEKEGVILPKLWAGKYEKYLDGLRLEYESDKKDAKCAMSIAILTKEPFGYADLEHDKDFEKWRAFALQYGYRSNQAIPFIMDGKCKSAFLIYSSRPFAFSERLVEYLKGIVDDVAMVIENTNRRKQAQNALQQAHDELEIRVAERTKGLRKSEEFNTQIIERSFDVIFMLDVRGFVEYASPATNKILGYTVEEVKGKHFTNYVQLVDHQKALRIFTKVAGGEVAENFELRLGKKNGSMIYVRVNAAPLIEGKKVISIMGYFNDITARRKREEENRSLKEYNENIMTSIPTVIITCDKKLIIKSINKARCTICGRKKSGHVGKHLSEILGPKVIKNEELDKKIWEVFKTKEPSQEMQIRHNFPKTGAKVLNLKIVGISHAGKEEVLLLLNDITEKKELQERIIQADKLASVGEMAAGLAHEINNPIAIIKGNAQYMQKKLQLLLSSKKFGKDEIKECAGILGRIAEEAERCGKITSGLLQFTRRGEDKLSLLDINQELATVLAVTEHNLSLAKVEVNQKLFTRLPKVLGHSGQLRQVFMNIILNAQDAMAQGGVLTVETSYDKNKKKVEIDFTDTGHGIYKENLDRLFDPFFTTKKPGKGVGLGLSISHGIITAYKGSIKVASKLGQGAMFRIRLPLGPKKK
ncbi:MAG: PAS domain S-box protein [Candidatus Omnitrophota bacterium]